MSSRSTDTESRMNASWTHDNPSSTTHCDGSEVELSYPPSIYATWKNSILEIPEVKFDEFLSAPIPDNAAGYSDEEDRMVDDDATSGQLQQQQQHSFKFFSDDSKRPAPSSWNPALRLGPYDKYHGAFTQRLCTGKLQDSRQAQQSQDRFAEPWNHILVAGHDAPYSTRPRTSEHVVNKELDNVGLNPDLNCYTTSVIPEIFYHDAEGKNSVDPSYQSSSLTRAGEYGSNHSFRWLDVPKARSPAPELSPPASSITPTDFPHILTCLEEDCVAQFTGTFRQGNFQRHMRLKHGHEERIYCCESQSCTKAYKRQDARLKHYRKCHPELDFSPIVPRQRKGLSSRPEREYVLRKAYRPRRLSREVGNSGSHILAKTDRAPANDRTPTQNDRVQHSPSGKDGTTETQNDRKSFDRHHNKSNVGEGQQSVLQKDHAGTNYRQAEAIPRLELDQKIKESGKEANGSQEIETTLHSPQAMKPQEGSTMHRDLGSNQPQHLHSDIRFQTSHRNNDGSRSPSTTSNESDDEDEDEDEDEASSIMTRLGHMRLCDWLSSFGVRTYGNGSKGTQSTGLSSDESAKTSSSAIRTSTGSKRSLDDLPDDNERKKRRKRRPRILYDQGEVAEALYACPFPKRNPRKYTRCWDFVFDKGKFADLKQHFDRHHRIPFHCPRCGVEFGGDNKDAERSRHLCQQPPCQETDLIGRWNGITADQWELIKKSKPRTMMEDEYWMHIYQILFDSRPLSGHPYHEDYKALGARILISSITNAVTNSISTFITTQGASGNPPDAIQSGMVENLTNLVETGVNAAFAMADTEDDYAPAIRQIPRLTATTTAPDLQGITEVDTINTTHPPIQDVHMSLLTGPENMATLSNEADNALPTQNTIGNDNESTDNNSSDPLVDMTGEASNTEDDFQAQHDATPEETGDGGSFSPLFENPNMATWLQNEIDDHTTDLDDHTGLPEAGLDSPYNGLGFLNDGYLAVGHAGEETFETN